MDKQIARDTYSNLLLELKEANWYLTQENHLKECIGQEQSRGSTYYTGAIGLSTQAKMHPVLGGGTVVRSRWGNEVIRIQEAMHLLAPLL